MNRKNDLAHMKTQVCLDLEAHALCFLLFVFLVWHQTLFVFFFLHFLSMYLERGE